jgi:hypothetical protein
MKDSDILDILIRQTHSKPEICQSSNNCNKFSHIIIQLYILLFIILIIVIFHSNSFHKIRIFKFKRFVLEAQTFGCVEVENRLHLISKLFTDWMFCFAYSTNNFFALIHDIIFSVMHKAI